MKTHLSACGNTATGVFPGGDDINIYRPLGALRTERLIGRSHCTGQQYRATISVVTWVFNLWHLRQDGND